MKLVLLFISFLSLFFIDISAVRVAYKEAVVSKEKTVELYEKLLDVKKTDSKKLVAYKGAVTALKSRLEKGVKNKKELFKKGISLVEYAVESRSNDIEIRFIRLSIQQNTPAFLKYNKDKEKDKAFVLSNLNTVKSAELKEYISGYIIESEHFSKEEKQLAR